MPPKSFKMLLDMTAYVKKVGADYLCAKCDLALIRVEPGGILCEELNQLDTMVIIDHHLAEHSPK